MDLFQPLERAISWSGPAHRAKRKYYWPIIVRPKAEEFPQISLFTVYRKSFNCCLVPNRGIPRIPEGNCACFQPCSDAFPDLHAQPTAKPRLLRHVAFNVSICPSYCTNISDARMIQWFIHGFYCLHRHEF